MGFLSHYVFKQATVYFDGRKILITCHDDPLTSDVWRQLSSKTHSDNEWEVHLVNAKLAPSKESISLPPRILVLGLNQYVKATNGKTDYYNYIGVKKRGHQGIRTLDVFTRFLWRHTTGPNETCNKNFVEAVKNALPPCTRVEGQRTREGTCSTGVSENTSEPEEDPETTGGDAQTTDVRLDKEGHFSPPFEEEDTFRPKDICGVRQVSEDRSSCCTETSADSTGGTQKRLIPTEEPQPAEYRRLLTPAQLSKCLSAIPHKRRPNEPERTMNGLFYAYKHGWPVPDEYGKARSLRKLAERWHEPGHTKRNGEPVVSAAPWDKLVSIFDGIISSTAITDQKPSSSGGPALPVDPTLLSDDQKKQLFAMFLQTINKPTSE